MVKQIGERFTIQDESSDILGMGGMGTVYRGIDTATGDQVAIKELKREVLHGNPEILERFEREADALRVLNHPNIVKVLASTAESDLHYIVMEYVSGGSLRDLIESKGKLPIERVLEISLDLADALTRAHRLKITHRDIKPANVMLAADGTPRLTDFGVARIDQKTRMTETGMVVGTLSYLSPEALDGSKPDERQDIWAFGIMLYEMLTGIRPYDGDTASAVITGILTKPVPDITEFRADIPQGLIRLLHWMLEKDPNNRINSVRKVGTEIENIIRGVDSDEYDLDSDFVHAVKDADHSRFETESDNEIQTPLTSFATAQSATKYGIPDVAGVKVVQNESGEEMLVVPARMALKGRKAFVFLTILAFVGLGAIITLLNTQNTDNTVQPNASTFSGLIVDGDGQTIEQMLAQIDPVAEDEFMVLMVPSFDLESEPEIREQFEPVIVDVIDTLERDIPFSNVRLRLAPTANMALPEALALFEASDADVMVLFESGIDKLDVTIQGGNLRKLQQSIFAEDLDDIRRSMFVEVEVTDPDAETLTPYILGTLSLVHMVQDDVFELMRTFAILEEVEKLPATLTSGGVLPSYYSFFTQFLSDTEQAAQDLGDAIEKDGGNPMWYAMRSAAYMRLNDVDQTLRDARTAQRIGPDGWTVPLIMQGAVSDEDGADAAILDEALEISESWFTYFLRGTFRYASNDINGAWDDIQLAIENSPQANYPYVTGFLIAMRRGEPEDAGRIMGQMIDEIPDPGLGTRVFRAMFGDNNFEIRLSGMLYEGYGNIVLGQYEPVIAFSDDLEAIMQDPSNIRRLSPGDTNNTQSYFAGDVFSMMGLANCATGDYETAHQWLTQGVLIDPTSPILRFIRVETANQLGLEEISQEDLTMIRGITDDFDELVLAAENKVIHCDEFFDYFASLAD